VSKVTDKLDTDGTSEVKVN